MCGLRLHGAGRSGGAWGSGSRRLYLFVACRNLEVRRINGRRGEVRCGDLGFHQNGAGRLGLGGVAVLIGGRVRRIVLLFSKSESAEATGDRGGHARFGDIPCGGMAGLESAGSGASEAAGNGWPSMVVPMRMTCMMGTPLIFCISLAMSVSAWPAAGSERASRRCPCPARGWSQPSSRQRGQNRGPGRSRGSRAPATCRW